MAQYSTNFSGYATGAAPADWTARWTTSNSTWAVREKSATQGGKTLEHTATADARRLLSWDAVDGDANRADADILVAIRSSYNSATKSFQLYFHGRASGAAGSENSYWASLAVSTSTVATNRELLLGKYVAGASTVLATLSDIPWVANAWYWLRFQITGTTIRARYWRNDQAEPGAWSLSTTDSAITAAGWIGVGNFDDTGTRDFDWIGIGTGADAPPAPPSTPSRISQAAIEVLIGQPIPVRVTQAVLEIVLAQPIPVRVTQAVLEILAASPPPLACPGLPPEPFGGVYPALPQGIASRRTPATVRDFAASVDGTPYLWDVFASIEYRFDLIHPAITLAQRTALMAFYAASAGLIFSFTWDGDDTIYDAIFETAPDIRALAARQGLTALDPLYFEARVRLRGRRQEAPGA